MNCSRSVVCNCPPQYNLNIVESGLITRMCWIIQFSLKISECAMFVWNFLWSNFCENKMSYVLFWCMRPHLKICMFPFGRPTHWKACRLKSFYLNFRSKFFFISEISGPFPSSLFPFLHFTITRSLCWYDCGIENENEKKQLFTYLPTLFLKGGSA